MAALCMYSVDLLVKHLDCKWISQSKYVGLYTCFFCFFSLSWGGTFSDCSEKESGIIWKQAFVISVSLFFSLSFFLSSFLHSIIIIILIVLVSISFSFSFDDITIVVSIMIFSCISLCRVFCLFSFVFLFWSNSWSYRTRFFWRISTFLTNRSQLMQVLLLVDRHYIHLQIITLEKRIFEWMLWTQGICLSLSSFFLLLCAFLCFTILCSIRLSVCECMIRWLCISLVGSYEIPCYFCMPKRMQHQSLLVEELCSFTCLATPPFNIESRWTLFHPSEWRTLLPEESQENRKP